MLAIDHVILGVHALDAATRRMEALGFGVADGGRTRASGPRTAAVRRAKDESELAPRTVRWQGPAQ